MDLSFLWVVEMFFHINGRVFVVASKKRVVQRSLP
jgi:hypothetical protein